MVGLEDVKKMMKEVGELLDEAEGDERIRVFGTKRFDKWGLVVEFGIQAECGNCFGTCLGCKGCEGAKTMNTMPTAESLDSTPYVDPGISSP